MAKKPPAKKRTLAEMGKTFDQEMLDYRKNRELWLAQHMEERKMISDFKVLRQKVDDLCGRFDQHLDDDRKQQELDRADRIERQTRLDDRLNGMDARWGRMEGAITQILDIKKSTEIMLKVAKWIAVVAGAIAAVVKFILPFLKNHK